ncbi:hypothetical protein LOK49_LG01G02673 [Camellia lanceoleosa]|uniref:Uncharacterized protein n=1 Tax=Camellia lanceoleosa TaxID=1840588 RepID=A0ACC0IZJ1_9ERIC|nr:hypothetical protein LOK49_LG01G02673 [Camellia lanceoleosa]
MELMKIGSFCNLLQLCKHLRERTKESTREENGYPRQPHLLLSESIVPYIVGCSITNSKKLKCREICFKPETHRKNKGKHQRGKWLSQAASSSTVREHSALHCGLLHYQFRETRVKTQAVKDEAIQLQS